MRRLRLAALLGVLGLMKARAALADETPRLAKQLTIDCGVASIGFTFGGRIRQSRVLLGAGGGFGVSPILGTVVATGKHFDPAPGVNLYEVANGQFFGRIELASWLRLDAGGRAGAFVHGAENYTGGAFAALFVAPALAWQWLSIGPRASGGLLFERGGEKAAALTFEYVIVRFVRSW